MKKTDQSIKSICKASINRNAGRPNEWKNVHHFEDMPESRKAVVEKAVRLAENELPILCCFTRKSNWLLITTRRVIGCYKQEVVDIVASKITAWDWGNFKGLIFGRRVDLLPIRWTEFSLITSEKVYRLEMPTGQESMAVIYGIRYVSGQHDQ
jgi:hypothetical protein